jgi:hypothetical protein
MAGRRQGHAPRRSPPPWSVEEQQACFVVGDRVGQAFAYVYFMSSCHGSVLGSGSMLRAR